MTIRASFRQQVGYCTVFSALYILLGVAVPESPIINYYYKSKMISTRLKVGAYYNITYVSETNT
jgi:hypothetical protein